jgi:hypothetical protein
LVLNIREENKKFIVIVNGITRYARIQFSKGRISLYNANNPTPTTIDVP